VASAELGLCICLTTPGCLANDGTITWARSWVRAIDKTIRSTGTLFFPSSAKKQFEDSYVALYCEHQLTQQKPSNTLSSMKARGYFGKSRNNKLLMSLRKKWGTSDPCEFESTSICKYFKRTATVQQSKNIVDDRTWADLDMTSFYADESNSDHSG